MMFSTRNIFMHVTNKALWAALNGVKNMKKSLDRVRASTLDNSIVIIHVCGVNVHR